MPRADVMITLSFSDFLKAFIGHEKADKGP